ncbi:MAG TPA: dynamin family protein [Acidimicrobiia bacterium]
MVALSDRSRSGDALMRLAGALESLDLGPDLAGLAMERDRLAGTIRSYLIPRLHDPDVPMTVVFAGPTGSGKSTLVNSLTGLDVSAAGVIRPTTKAPVVLASAAHAADYTSIAGVTCEVVTGTAPVLAGMTLVDTPDLDSTSVEHRALAERLIDNADVVIFVTSALRYADEVPWQVLRRAVARGTDVIHVLNRVGSATSGAAVDFRSRLAAAGMDDTLITVPEHHLRHGAQRVPSIAVRSLGRRLAKLAGSRGESADTIYARVLRSTVGQVAEFSHAVRESAHARDDLEAEVSVEMAARAAGLYTAGIGDGLSTPPPERGQRWAMRRWRRANTLDAATIGGLEQTVVDRVIALVHGDLRRWLADESGFPEVPPSLIVGETLPAVRSAAEAWILYVRRMVEEIGETDRWLGESALIAAATDEEESAAAIALWGEHSEVLVDRARRELTGRLDVVYQHAGVVLVDLVCDGRGSLDDTDLRSALGAVTATLALVDA